MTLGKLALVAIAAVALSGCTDPTSATKVLTQAGYSDIQMTGYDWLACGKDDTYHTGFRAKGPTGAIVNGVVCKGVFFKSSTIRFDD